MLTLEAPVKVTAKVYTEEDYRHFYGMLTYREFLANLEAGTLDNYRITTSTFGA